MEVIYLGHSGFLLKWQHCDWLFDYYEGTLPRGEGQKTLFVFVSHKHQDHFNPEIFSIQGYREIHYILSHDTKRQVQKLFPTVPVHFLRAGESLRLPVTGTDAGLKIRTLRSTDCGVAFLVTWQGKTIYHAGDLNWWVWKGESKQYNNNMTANFLKYTEPLKGQELFAAFLPLDPRQEEWYSKGMLHILETARVSYAFPMHFWKDFSVIQVPIFCPRIIGMAAEYTGGKTISEHRCPADKRRTAYLLPASRRSD